MSKEIQHIDILIDTIEFQLFPFRKMQPQMGSDILRCL
jgi:hypothetical protein